MGMISSTPNSSARPGEDREQIQVSVGTRISRTPRPSGDGEQHEVDGVLVLVGDGPLRQDLLQLAHGHQAAGEGEEAEQRFDHQRHHHEAVQSSVAACGCRW